MDAVPVRRKHHSRAEIQIEEMVNQMQSDMNESLLPIDSKHLFEELCTDRILLQGWKEVKRNRGTSGSDGQTIEEFALQLSERDRTIETRVGELEVQTGTGETNRNTETWERSWC